MNRWLLLGAVGALITIIGCGGGDTTTVINRTVTEGGTNAGGTATTAEGPAPPCTKHEAEQLAAHGAYNRAIFNLGAAQLPQQVVDVYTVRVLACQDLNGDGQKEMVVQALCCTGSSPTPWAIFEAESGAWKPALIRSRIPAVLSVNGDQIREKSPAYTEKDALCCPSGFRRGTVAWNGSKFVYEPQTGVRDRSIVIGSSGPESIGGLPLQTASLGDATQLFGVPSGVTSSGSTCHVSWLDLGLAIYFANFGSGGSCGIRGRVASVDLRGFEAEQAGWATTGGVHVGMSFEQLSQLYPNVRPTNRETYFRDDTSGSAFALISRKVPYAGGSVASLAALASEGQVIALYLGVGAAGE